MPGAEVVDGAGHTLMPGLVMLHEHMFYPSGQTRYNTNQVSFPPLYLAGGVTTMRTGGSMDTYTDLSIRREIEAGRIPGPHMDVTGPYLEGPGGFIWAFPALATPDQARAHVNFWADLGVTSFKAYNLIDRATLGAAIQAAHARGIKVTGHLCSITYREAADLGIDNLEHGFFAATDWVADKRPDACPRGADQSYLDLDLSSAAFTDLVAHLVESGCRPDVDAHRGRTARAEPSAAAPGGARGDAPSASRAGRGEARPGGRAGGTGPACSSRRTWPWRRPSTTPAASSWWAPTRPAEATSCPATRTSGRSNSWSKWGSRWSRRSRSPPGTVRATWNVRRTSGPSRSASGPTSSLLEGDPTSDPAAFRHTRLVFKDGVGYDSVRLFDSVKGWVGVR